MGGYLSSHTHCLRLSSLDVWKVNSEININANVYGNANSAVRWLLQRI